MQPCISPLVNFDSTSSGLNSCSGKSSFRVARYILGTTKSFQAEILQKKVRVLIVASPTEVLLALIGLFDHCNPVVMIQRTGNTD